MSKRANVHQGSVHVTADETMDDAKLLYPFTASFDGDAHSAIVITEQEARDLHACLDAALIQWDEPPETPTEGDPSPDKENVKP